jgi:hypothetical protein
VLRHRQTFIIGLGENFFDKMNPQLLGASAHQLKANSRNQGIEEGLFVVRYW